MSRPAAQAAQAQWEYLALLGLVLVAIAGLIVVGEGHVDRRPPVRPLTVLVAPIQPPAVPRVRPSPRPPRGRRPPAPGPTIVAPRWALR